MKKFQMRGSRGHVIKRCEGGTTGGPRQADTIAVFYGPPSFWGAANVPQEPYQKKVTSTYKLKKKKVPLLNLVEFHATLSLLLTHVSSKSQKNMCFHKVKGYRGGRLWSVTSH